MTERFGAYIHIPFCIQRCRYCDFATYSKDQIQANDDYVDHVCQEIRLRREIFEKRNLNTIYFGGGTPSLLSSHQIERIVSEFSKQGFGWAEDIEITLEVNPATLTDEKARGYKDLGVNRLSIGSQTFSEKALKACNREHNVQDTFDTIELTQKYFNNYSLDLLFSLPEQTMEQLLDDLEIIKKIQPPHVSPYCLTLPEAHPFNINRCSDDEQISMFLAIESALQSIGLMRYEISNFAKPGSESRHNLLYWEDQDYWGLGLSAHSYKRDPQWGSRFWNASSYKAYISQIDNLSHSSLIWDSFPKEQYEKLSLPESLTDFCHTHLRLESGLKKSGLRQKYGDGLYQRVNNSVNNSVDKGWIKEDQDSWRLTETGRFLSNQVFSEVLFSGTDVDNS